jgi:hypothetical protein
MKDLLKNWIENLYKYMGWVDIDPDGNILHGLIEQARKDPGFVELANLYSTYKAPEDKRRAIQVLRQLFSG